MDPAPTLEALREAARALTCGDARTQVRAFQTAQDALDAAKAAALAELEATREFELDGASTLNTWVRNELRLGAKEAAMLVRAAPTLKALPSVAEAASSGRIRAQHVAAFAYGLKHVGPETMTGSESWLLDVAESCEPNQLFQVIRALRDAIYPDELNQAWVDGMDKQDIQVTPVPDGWHVTGFLNPVTGAKLKTVLDSISAPRDKDDTRPGAERRVDGLDHLMTSILDSGLPSDKGVRPHVSVIVDADTLDHALHNPDTANETPVPAGEPATLTGYGPIGPQLLGYLACGADLTGILTRGNTKVLDVGRTSRLATLKQRHAIIARQHGICAAPGCHNTHVEIHHTIWWSRGGTTHLNQLIGLCVRCHHLVHRELLNITGDTTTGYNFTNQHLRPLRRTTRENDAARHTITHIRQTARDIEHQRQEFTINQT